MKKFLSAVLAVMFLSTAAFAVDINLKVGADLASSLSQEVAVAYGDGYNTFHNNASASLTPEMGFRAGGEILFPIGSVVKLGLGLQYLLPRKIDKDADLKVSVFEPIYGTVQINPIPAAKEVFIKGNIGFAVISNDDQDVSNEAALSLGISAGYEFPFGLILELGYTHYSWSTESSFASLPNWSKTTNDWSLGIFGLNVGYKFKLGR